jgi:ABC-type phosphate/phosphonate transport system permease subunit
VSYNRAIWPIQIITYVLGALSIASLFRRTRAADRVITGVLAAMWLWTGVAYHALSFSAINNAAYIFAALFVVQGCCLVYAGVYRDQIRFGLLPILATGAGISLVAYAAIAYPLAGLATGHRYPEMPMFGVTPCPVTIFTFGMLLLTVRPVPNWLLAIPFVWSLIGGSAAVLLNVPQDWFLLMSGLITSLLMFFRDRHQAVTG